MGGTPRNKKYFRTHPCSRKMRIQIRARTWASQQPNDRPPAPHHDKTSEWERAGQGAISRGGGPPPRRRQGPRASAPRAPEKSEGTQIPARDRAGNQSQVLDLRRSQRRTTCRQQRPAKGPPSRPRGQPVPSTGPGNRLPLAPLHAPRCCGPGCNPPAFKRSVALALVSPAVERRRRGDVVVQGRSPPGQLGEGGSRRPECAAGHRAGGGRPAVPRQRGVLKVPDAPVDIHRTEEMVEDSHSNSLSRWGPGPGTKNPFRCLYAAHFRGKL